jgi:uncharacterized protein
MKTRRAALAKWLRRAEAGDAAAQLALGEHYGRVAPKDQRRAVFWYRRAAAQGHLDAMHLLAYNLYFGIGAPNAVQEARRWLESMARSGDPRGMYNLGETYELPGGGSEDLAEAAKWYRRAAAEGYADGNAKLGVLMCNGLIPGDRAQARAHLEIGARAGNAGAQTMLGVMYHAGTDVPRDDDKAVELYRKAAAQGEPVAMYNLSLCYLDGHGVKKSKRLYSYWLRRSIEAL